MRDGWLSIIMQWGLWGSNRTCLLHSLQLWEWTHVYWDPLSKMNRGLHLHLRPVQMLFEQVSETRPTCFSFILLTVLYSKHAHTKIFSGFLRLRTTNTHTHRTSMRLRQRGEYCTTNVNNAGGANALFSFLTT